MTPLTRNSLRVVAGVLILVAIACAAASNRNSPIRFDDPRLRAVAIVGFLVTGTCGCLAFWMSRSAKDP